MPHGNAGFAKYVDLFLQRKPQKPDVTTASRPELLAACAQHFHYIFHAGHIANEDVKSITIFPVDSEVYCFQLELEPSPTRPGRPQINRTWFFNSVMRCRMQETGKSAKQVSLEVFRDYHECLTSLISDPNVGPIGIPKPKSLQHLSSKKMKRPEHVTDDLIQIIDQLVRASVSGTRHDHQRRRNR